MTLSAERARAYGLGALTGGFGAVALLAGREGRRGVAAAALLASVVCGALSVSHEERAQDRARE